MEAFQNGGEYTLTEDVTISEPLTLDGDDKKLTLNLGTYTITAANSDAIVDKNSAELTITGNGAVKVMEGANGCAVWAHHEGSVIIENGTFSTNDDADGDRCDCIYAGSTQDSSKGNIEIKGGLFMYDGQNVNGHNYLLNLKDNTGSTIKVTGGTFHKFNPAVSYGEPDSPVNFVAEGYKVITSTDEDGVMIYTVTEE